MRQNALATTVTKVSQDDNAPSPALVLAELADVERSATFRHSSRHRRLLRHLVERVLAGKADSLKESVLAAEVFGRDPGDFDPCLDTSVRVEIGRLRRKLARYYATEGANASLLLQLEPGRYAPRFELHPEPRGAGLPSLAVLPFVNLTGRSRDEYVCDALTEELIDALVQIPGLKVTARTSVFAFKGRCEDVREIGRALGVRALVEGSLQRSHGRWRVVAQLIDTADGTHGWSHAFDDASGSPSNLVLPLAQAIVAGLRLSRESAAPLARSARRLSADVHACDCWHRGRYLLGRHSADAYRSAIELFRRAVTADPAFALAWMGIALGSLRLAGLSPYPDATLVAAARAAVRRMFELDAQMGVAHAIDAFIAFALDRDFARAERASQTALRYAPADVYVHHNHAWMLTMAGRFREASAAFAIAAELDPLDPNLRVHYGLMWFYRRDFVRADEHFQRVLDMEPGNIVARALHASTLLNAGDHEAARARFAEIARDWPEDSIGPLGIVQAEALAGRRQRAGAAFAAMIARFGAERVGPYRMAIAHARLADSDAAFAALDRAQHLADMNLICLPVDPSFDALRDHPRWQPALERYGLPSIDPRAAQIDG